MTYDDLPKPFFVLAPMDDVTDTVFRQVVAACAPPDLFFTEFVNVDGLMSAGRPQLLKKLRFAESEGRVVVQLWGLKPENFRAVAEQIADGSLAHELGLPDGVNFCGVDLNMGCPAKSEVKSGTCAALIRPESRELARQIIEAAKEGLAGELPISVKTRVGFSAVDMTWFEFLLSQDLDMLTVHGRTRKQMSKVPADWELIGRVRQMRDDMGARTLIVGNGDVLSHAQGAELATRHRLDGIMIGRGVFHDPFVFLEDGPIKWADYDKTMRLDLYRKHVERFAETWQNGERPVHTLNKFCKIYINGFDGASALRSALMMAESSRELLDLLDNAQKSHETKFVSQPAVPYDTSMTKEVKAIIFDSDGTLLDTRQLILQGYKTVLERHGLNHLATDQYISDHIGKPVPETYQQILAGHNIDIPIEQLAAEHDVAQDQLVHLIKPYPKSAELLRSWKRMGIKLCLFTSGKQTMIERNFTAAGMPDINDIFDAIISADDNIAHKPEPDAIEELMRQIDVKPENAVVVGDHAYDMIAATRAHAGLCIGVLHGFGTSHELLNAGADFLADNLSSLNDLMRFATD